VKKFSLTIGWLYADLANTYGDRGNIICLYRRCKWRGIKVEVCKIGLNEKEGALSGCDLFFMGGAQDRQQKIVANDLGKNKGPVLKKMIENGVSGLFVCGAYQFLGHYYRPAEGEDIKGLSIFDLSTRHFGKNRSRCIGNVVVKVEKRLIGKEITLVGFENHGGRTYLGDRASPLGKVKYGYGNNGEDKTEGCVYKNAIGTYLHGPLLPKNPHLADFLIKSALEKRYKTKVQLRKIDDCLESKSKNYMLKRLGVKR